MFPSIESELPSMANVRLIEQAMKSLKQNVAIHLERESRLERFYMGWQQKWLLQCEQLRVRIESLEAQLSPWMVDQTEGPRLALVSHPEESV